MDRMETKMDTSTKTGPASRLGAVDMANVALIESPRLEDSAEFNDFTTRLKAGEAVTQALQERGEVKLDVLLTRVLDQMVEQSKLSGLMIASEDGFPIAQSSEFRESGILAALGCLFQLTVRRAQSEGVLEAVEEMTLRGFAGEQVVVRFLRSQEKRYFLVAYSQGICPYRRATARALDYCGSLLQYAAGGPASGRKIPSLPVPPGRKGKAKEVSDVSEPGQAG